MIGQSNLQLTPLGRFPGKRVLTWHGKVLYASNRYKLLRWDPEDGGSGWAEVAQFRPGLMRRLSATTRLGYRLHRDGFHALEVLPDGSLVAVLPKAIAMARPGSREFEVTCRVQRGTRPLTLAATPQGSIYWGEYFDNRDHAAVHVYGSQDAGHTWDVVYTFPAGTIRHIHSITYDPFDNSLWVLTGDDSHECRIIRATCDWSTVDTVLAGNQQARAVTLVPTLEGLYFATDTPLETNYIYRLERRGNLERLSSISGSNFWSCKVGQGIFFSAAVEPSPGNDYPFACLYGSTGGEGWLKLLEWRKDPWPMRLFQYGNIILPRGINDSNILAATGFAVRGEDLVMHAWRVSG